MIRSVLLQLYHLLLRLYPSSFRVEYGEEIELVFGQVLASKPGWSAWRLVWRELVTAPPVLLRLHVRAWRRGGIRLSFSIPDLPTQDGRHSWGLAGLEALFFLAWTGLLVLLTYANFAWLKPGWYRDLALLGNLAVVLPLPILLLGLGRGLPRWVYPFYGLLLAYLGQAAWRFQLGPLLAVCSLVVILLTAAAARLNGRRPLPAIVLHLGRSLQLDPLRWSFAVYGAAPLLLLLAYDDGLANNRTPCFFLSALGMLLGGLGYTRLRAPLCRVAALVAGLALATWPALLDRVALTGVIQPGEAAAVLSWWGAAMALLLVPPVISGASVLFNRMVQKGN